VAILWIGHRADFGTINHTGKQRLASFLIDSKVRKVPVQIMTNFRIGTLADHLQAGAEPFGEVQIDESVPIEAGALLLVHHAAQFGG
jgi:hypothetical protein